MSHEDSTPPLFKTWRSWYWLVMGLLALQIALFWWLTQTYSA